MVTDELLSFQESEAPISQWRLRIRRKLLDWNVAFIIENGSKGVQNVLPFVHEFST